MPTYTVHLTETVSTAVTVEADSPEDAIDLAYDSDDMPGGMCYGAFGADANVDESGTWEAAVVTDEDGKEVWAQKDGVVWVQSPATESLPAR